jgi:uncharacterized membrane-anchored protein
MNMNMSTLPKIAVVLAVQLLIVGSMIAFKQYTVWTGETVVIKTAPVDPRDPFRGDYLTLSYEISRLDTSKIAGDDYPYDTVYVELREGDDGYWHAVAIHDRREREFDGTVLLKGEVDYRSGARSDRTTPLRYGFEEFFIPEGSGRNLDIGRDQTLALRLKVDRFGNAVAQKLLLDGEPLDLKRRG